jgi:hypothetical protein
VPKSGQSVRLARSTVGDYVARARRAGVKWPLPADLDDAGLESKLFPPPVEASPGRRPEPDWRRVHRELKRGRHVQLLWLEWRSAHPEGWAYSQFCLHYRHWLGFQDIVIRLEYRAGDRLFVDYSCDRMPVPSMSTLRGAPAVPVMNEPEGGKEKPTSWQRCSRVTAARVHHGRVGEVPDPEVPERAQRRQYSAAYKLKILAEYDGPDRGRGPSRLAPKPARGATWWQRYQEDSEPGSRLTAAVSSASVHATSFRRAAALSSSAGR